MMTTVVVDITPNREIEAAENIRVAEAADDVVAQAAVST
jgi:hypothetical protein